MKKKEEKKSVKEGMIFFGERGRSQDMDNNAKKMCGFGNANRVRDADSYQRVLVKEAAAATDTTYATEPEYEYQAKKDGAGVGAGSELGFSDWEGTIKGETHIECRGRAKTELRRVGLMPSYIPYITKYGDMIVSFGGGMLGFLILAAIVGTIIALKNTRKGISLFDDLIKKKKEEKEKCDAHSKEGKCVDEIVGTTPSRTQLRMRLETQEKEDYEIRKSEADQKGLQDAVTMMSRGGSKAYRNKRSKKKGGSRKRK